MSAAATLLPFGYEHIYRQEIEWRRSGELPEEQFIDVHFDDVVRDPVATISEVYRRLGWPFTPEVGERIAEYAKAKPKGSRGVHQYSLEEVGLDAAAERERFSFYTEHYGVREE